MSLASIDLLFLRNNRKGCRDGLAGKSTGYPCRGRGFNSQHPIGSSQLFVNSHSRRFDALFWYLWVLHTYGTHTYTQAIRSYTPTRINKSRNNNKETIETRCSWTKNQLVEMALFGRPRTFWYTLTTEEGLLMQWAPRRKQEHEISRAIHTLHSEEERNPI